VAVIWCLHGFLGRPSDWDFLGDTFEIRAIDLFRDGLDPLREAAPDDFLLGYSMGGRLALVTLLERSFRGAVIVSAGLNVEGVGERATRLREDERWARRFESEEWSSLLSAWNAQSLFAGEVQPFERIESDYDRRTLANALRNWSPAVLEPLARRLPEIESRVLWIAGERDPKYVAVAERAVALLPDAELWICRGAGHRVPWDQPDQFIDRVQRFAERGADVDQPSRL
jgi:2-succinyl-6-hydroxy-2,4-cyclohexadiene-1-carboxylate synthase